MIYMKTNEMRFQVAVSALQGVLEAKFGIVGEVAPAIAVKESLLIADEFVKQWQEKYGDTEEEKDA